MTRNFDNPSQRLFSVTEAREDRHRPVVEEITSDEELRAFYRQREINRQVPADKTAYLDRFANDRLSEYRDSKGNIRVYVIKEAGKIIAGGQMEIEGPTDNQRAYLGMKFVNPEKRGRKLAAELVKKRLEVAKELGCKQAYSLVRKENFPALRSIVKDGFDIASTSKQAGLEHLKDEYFLFRDLTTETPPSKIELARVQGAVGKADLSGKELVVPLSDTEIIEKAFQAGFEGKFVFDANELPGIHQQAMYLEK